MPGPFCSVSAGNEKERLARAWVSPASPAAEPHGHGQGHGPRLPPRLHLAVMERLVFVEPLPEAAQRRWVHVCASWEGHSGQYRLYVEGKLRRAGVRPEVSRGDCLPHRRRRGTAVDTHAHTHTEMKAVEFRD